MAEEQEATKSKNKVTIESAGPCKKKVIIEMPQQVISEAADEQYEVLRKDAVVPGFRRGRAPRRLLEKRFGKETSEQIKLKLLADASDSAIKDNKLDVLREPDIDYENVELPAEGALKFEFEVEVRPEFELPELKGIPVEKRKLEVTDEQVGREIEQLCRWSGLWTPREEGGAELDDQIIADVLLNIEDGQQEEKLDNVEIYVRAQGFVGGVPVEKLDKLLVGTTVGQEKQIVVEVPKTYFKEEYRGKKIDVKIAAKDIKWLKPAEVDEHFLQRVGVDSADELREKIRDRLLGRLESEVRAEMTEQIYRYMLDKADFELPLDVVADQAANLLQRQYVNLISRGLAREQIEEQMEQLRAGSEQQAKNQLKTYFIMDKVADKLGIEVTEEEINGQIARLAIQRQQRPERLKEQMARDGSLAQFRLQVREEKCVAKLLESAQIKEMAPEATAKEDSSGRSLPEHNKKKTKKTAKKTAKSTDSKKKGPQPQKTAAGNPKKETKKARPTRRKKKTET